MGTHHRLTYDLGNIDGLPFRQQVCPTMPATTHKSEYSGSQQLMPPGTGNWRDTWHKIIFEADTPSGKIFDLLLLAVITFNLVIICLETVSPWDQPQFRNTWLSIEWTCTALFTIEYIMRLMCVKRPFRYALSFYGIVDMLSILPLYLTWLIGAPAQSFAVIRTLRLLRVFRVLNLSWLVNESDDLWRSVWQARAKVVVFLFVVIVSVTIAGTLMYEIEGRHFESDTGTIQQFDSIPSSIYWAIVTMTTVGYGDIVPRTAAGKAVSSVLILLGYSLIIVPTGFVSAEFAKKGSADSDAASPDASLRCDLCTGASHDNDSKFCKFCGQRLKRILANPKPVAPIV